MDKLRTERAPVKGRGFPRPADPGAEVYRLTLAVSRLDAEVAALRAEVRRLREANTAAFAYIGDLVSDVDGITVLQIKECEKLESGLLQPSPGRTSMN